MQLQTTRTRVPQQAPAEPPGQRGLAGVGIVVIGRNEGDRLRTCLHSAMGQRVPLVYVDSGSTDLSVPFAREKGIDAVELDDSVPFTAARARNAGFDRLCGSHPHLEFVQFVDGDCELCESWLRRAMESMAHLPEAAIVCGRVRERFPKASFYNRVCELEWKQPAGQIDGCGGNMLIRVSAFRQAGGFNPEIIAAEDTELCARLQLHGWKIFSMESDMVLHDAAMLRFDQWWRRALRAGHAMTECAARHGKSPRRLFVKASRRILVYGLLLPLAVILSAWSTTGWSLLLLTVYPLQFLKTYRGLRRRGENRGDAAVYAAHCVLAKFPQAVGQLTYWGNRILGRRARIIEHKRAVAIAAQPEENSGTRAVEA